LLVLWCLAQRATATFRYRIPVAKTEQPYAFRRAPALSAVNDRH
jgi:hypothetical protein